MRALLPPASVYGVHLRCCFQKMWLVSRMFLVRSDSVRSYFCSSCSVLLPSRHVVRISRVIYAMPATSAPSAGHILHRGTVAGAGVANPRAAGSIAANGVGWQPCGRKQGGRCLTPPPWMSAAYLNINERFKRIGEATDSFISRGGFFSRAMTHSSG